MGHRDRVDKTRRALARHVGTRITFTATLVTRSIVDGFAGMEGTTTRYLLHHVTVVDPSTRKPVIDRRTGNPTTVDHCWVSCPAIEQSFMPFPCAITFIATVVSYCKTNWQTGIGLAGVEIISWKAARTKKKKKVVTPPCSPEPGFPGQ